MKITEVMGRKITMASSSIISNLNLDDSPNYKVADGLQNDSHHHKGVPDWIGKQRPDESRVQHQHGGHDDGRQQHQQQHGHSPLGGKYPHLALDLESFTNHIGQV